MEQNDKLVRNTGSTSRTVGHVLADLSNLRDFLTEKPGSDKVVNPPAEGSVAQLLLAAAQRPVAEVKVDLSDPTVLAKVAKAVADEIFKRGYRA